MKVLVITDSLISSQVIYLFFFFSEVRVEEVVGWAWDVFQPLLFGLIGAQIRFSELDGFTVGETKDR